MKNQKNKIETEDALRSCGVEKTYEKGAVIYFQQEEGDTLYYILQGRVWAYLQQEEGETLTVEILPRGRIFGESGYLTHSRRLTTMQAVTRCRLICFTWKDLKELMMQDAGIMDEILYLFSLSVTNLTHLVSRISFLDGPEKVADYLLEMTSQASYSMEITQDCLPYSHEEIAMALSLQRSTVTRILRDFEKRGWVELAYKKVYILDKNALKQLAGK